MLVDTGSSTNLLSADLVNKLELQNSVEEGTFKLIGVTGAPLQTLGVIRKLPIVINGTLLESDFIVSNMANESCILGQTFMEAHNVVLNFERKVMHSPCFSVQLNRGISRNKIFLVTTNDCLISGFNVLTCNLASDDTSVD